jgi:urea transport system substrate-binding protein
MRARHAAEPSIASWNARRFAVGVFIPLSGPAGVWGSSCHACARLAAEEINASGGLDGRPLELTVVDAGGDPAEIGATAESLILEGKVDAIVGMHTSDVRTVLARTVAGKVPYVYTPLYEGGERHAGVFCIGETPRQQLIPSVDWLSDRYRCKKWFLVGNDYVWPRTTHRLLWHHFAHRGLTVTGEKYLPFNTEAFGPVLEEIRQAKPDAVLVSLVGQDSIVFNRAFAKAGLAGRVLRFSCAVEENLLLGIGDANVEGLFGASHYFSVIDSRANGAFLERYQQRFGDRAPTLCTLGQGLYEGMYFLRSLSDASHGQDWRSFQKPIAIASGVRGAVFGPQRVARAQTYLVEAQGYDFRIRCVFP